jgi:predicted metal-dependent phosphoesterase TrpH
MRTATVDPHIHSADSYDATASVPELLAAAADAGLDGVVVTDHDRIERSLWAAELAPDYGLVAVPGVEVSTTDGHLLALGVDRCPERGRPLGETIRTVHDLGGVAVVPHPFQRSRHGVRKRRLAALGVRPDAVEVYNAFAMTGVQNRRAREFAVQHGYPGLGGSDAHTAEMVGRTRTEIGVDEHSAAAILDGIRAGATAVRGESTSLSRYVRKFAGNARLRTRASVQARMNALF